MSDEARPSFPPFTEETAREKVSLAYTEDSVWRNRDEFFEGQHATSSPANGRENSIIG